MITVEEIEQAAERLAPSDFDRLAAWISARYHELWSRQMEKDAAAGKLDFLFNEAEAEREQKLFERFKADESAQALTAKRRIQKPEDNNERQPIHSHGTAVGTR